ncbi:hypothetical protein Acsp01_68360 [Actinoplanes sp. NBRC 101535]|nr:hypothetical protein Acsp01_68360 [Actinoplanes sp. NBRC 101535]
MEADAFEPGEASGLLDGCLDPPTVGAPDPECLDRLADHVHAGESSRGAHTRMSAVHRRMVSGTPARLSEDHV